MSKSKINVLLVGWGGFAGTSVVDSLHHNFEKRSVNVVCTDMVDKPVLREKADGFYILPKGNTRNYIPELIKLCKKEKIDVILPGSSPEILNLSKNIAKLCSQNIKVALDDYSRIKKLMSKEQVYSILSKNNIQIPKYIHVKTGPQLLDAIKKLGFPKNAICFKPASYFDSGSSRGFKILRASTTIHDVVFGKPGSNKIDYDSILKLSKTSKALDLLVMEYLPGTEFSVYTLSKNGKMIFCIPHVRERLELNHLFEATTVKNNQIEQICKKIIKLFDLSYNINIQIKLSKNGTLKIVEINPRMGGSIVLPKVAGVDLPFFAVKQALGEPIPTNKNPTKTKMLRYIKEIFINQNGSQELS